MIQFKMHLPTKGMPKSRVIFLNLQFWIYEKRCCFALDKISIPKINVSRVLRILQFHKCVELLNILLTQCSLRPCNCVILHNALQNQPKSTRGQQIFTITVSHLIFINWMCEIFLNLDNTKFCSIMILFAKAKKIAIFVCHF